MHKHAYLILAHGQWDLLGTLIATIDDARNDIFIHIDAKVRDIPALSADRAGLFILKERTDARWGDVSLVEAEYALFETASRHSEEYAYFHLLSGVDLPLKSQDYIHSWFDSHSGEEFIGYTEITPGPLTVRMVMRYHLFPRSFKSKSFFVRAPRALFLKLQEAAGRYRNRDIDFKKGSNWCSVTPDMVKLLLDRKEWVLKTFSHTFCSDEIYIQTVCWNSPLRSNIHSLESDGAGCLRAIGWRDGCLYDWSAQDYETLASSGALFARKFNLSDRGFLRKIVSLSLPDAPQRTSAPAVSVIVPVYNAAGILGRSLASLKSQTFKDFEVVFVDDCSTDGSPEILDRFAETSGLSCRIVRQAVNGGVAAARNAGIENARGEYIAWLDADDAMMPTALEKALDAAMPTVPGRGADIVGFDWRLGFERNSRYMRQADWSSPLDAIKALCGGTARWNLWLFLMRRDFVRTAGLEFTPGADIGEDMAFVLKAFSLASGVTQIHDALYLYNAVNSGSISKSFTERRRQETEENVARAKAALEASPYAEETAPYIDRLKLCLKLPLLVSGEKADYLLWLSWMPEANAGAFENKALPLRTRILQWMASKRLRAGVRLYFVLVYKFVYGVIYR